MFKPFPGYILVKPLISSATVTTKEVVCYGEVRVVCYGEVISIGMFIDDLKVGDEVFYYPEDGTPVMIQDLQYTFLEIEDIVGKVLNNDGGLSSSTQDNEKKHGANVGDSVISNFIPFHDFVLVKPRKFKSAAKGWRCWGKVINISANDLWIDNIKVGDIVSFCCDDGLLLKTEDSQYMLFQRKNVAREVKATEDVPGSDVYSKDRWVDECVRRINEIKPSSFQCDEIKPNLCMKDILKMVDALRKTLQDFRAEGMRFTQVEIDNTINDFIFNFSGKWCKDEIDKRKFHEQPREIFSKNIQICIDALEKLLKDENGVYLYPGNIDNTIRGCLDSLRGLQCNDRRYQNHAENIRKHYTFQNTFQKGSGAYVLIDRCINSLKKLIEQNDQMLIEYNTKELKKILKQIRYLDRLL